MDDTLVSNIILNINSNCIINLSRYVNSFGGKYCGNLPAVRRIVRITGLRY
jgi:hypothetical protein